MGELGGTVEYLYWSSRRTSRFLEDNDLVVQPVTRTVASPSFSWLPTFSRSTTSSGSLRPKVAKVIERALGQIAVTRFNAPGPIKYAKGSGSVVFGEFKTWLVQPVRQPAVMFTAVDYDRRNRGSVAICLFGSMDNFPEFVQSTGPGIDGRDLAGGWVSSSAPAVYNFLKSHGRQFDDLYYRPEDMAVEALKIADGQGMRGDALGMDKPWQRAFTYGDVQKAQWLAQIYLDVDLLATDDGAVDGFRRVLVGAPLWIRTPGPRAVRLYATSDDLDVVESWRPRVKRSGFKTAEVSSHTNMDHDDISKVGTSETRTDDDEHQTEVSAEQSIILPYRIYRTLQAGFVVRMADWVIQRVDINAEHRIIHLGDPFGTVFSWVWNRDRDQAMVLLADYLAALRDGHPLAGDIDPPIRLDEVLTALRPALPSRFGDYDEVVAMARREVRQYYGADPNA